MTPFGWWLCGFGSAFAVSFVIVMGMLALIRHGRQHQIREEFTGPNGEWDEASVRAMRRAIRDHERCNGRLS